MEGVLGHEVCHLRGNSFSGSDKYALVGHEHMFRIMGDVTHLCGIYLLVVSCFSRRTAAGVSLRSQEMFLVTYLIRYLNPLHAPYATVYRLCLASGFIAATLGLIVGINFSFPFTYDAKNDRCPHYLFYAFCLLYALCTPAQDIYEKAWIFGVLLEGFALAPQVLLLRHTSDVPNYVPISFYMLGGYPIFYFLHYITQYHSEAYCQPMTAVTAGVLQVAMLTVGSVVINSTWGMRDNLTRSALSRMHQTRERVFGLEGEVGLQKLEEEVGGESRVYVWASGLLDITECLLQCGQKFAPDLELPPDPEMKELPSTQRGGLWRSRGAMDRDRVEYDNTLWNLLPFKISRSVF